MMGCYVEPIELCLVKAHHGPGGHGPVPGGADTITTL